MRFGFFPSLNYGSINRQRRPTSGSLLYEIPLDTALVSHKIDTRRHTAWPLAV